MLKYLTLLLVQLSFLTNAQIDISPLGFGEITLGKSYDELKNRCKEVEIPPSYAWFCPMSIDEFMDGSADQDSSSYFSMLETERLIAESLGVNIVWCTFTKKQEERAFQFPIECAQLVFDHDSLIGIFLVFNKEDMNAISKRSILNQLETALGDPTERTNNDETFMTKWTSESTEVMMSDANGWDFKGLGENLTILFGK